jgi:flagellar biosynthetic protein FliR
VLLDQSPLYLENFVLILTRVSAMLLSSPMFSVRGMPPHTKIGLAVFITLIFLPLESTELLGLPPGLVPFVLAIGRELLIGLIIGFAVTLVFTGFHMAAQLMSVQIGFNVGSLLDPITGFQSSPLDQFYSVLVMLIFLSIDGHYQLIVGLQQTFEVAPLASFDVAFLNPDHAIALAATMFVVALQITMPLMAALLLADLGMAILARTVPQIPVFMVGMPGKVAMGLVVLMITLPAMALVMEAAFGRTVYDVSFMLSPE